MHVLHTFTKVACLYSCDNMINLDAYILQFWYMLAEMCSWGSTCMMLVLGCYLLCTLCWLVVVMLFVSFLSRFWLGQFWISFFIDVLLDLNACCFLLISYSYYIHMFLTGFFSLFLSFPFSKFFFRLEVITVRKTLQFEGRNLKMRFKFIHGRMQICAS